MSDLADGMLGERLALMSDQDYIQLVLIDELKARLDKWSEEYQQPRDLGVRGEFVGLYRKCRKLKTIYWDQATDGAGWREDRRTILFEVIGHALLMLLDEDSTSGRRLDEQE